jgi:hypothetical protein
MAMPSIDITIPAVVLDAHPDAAGGLNAIRSLGRLGVAVFGVHDSPWAPAAQSRYLAGRLFVRPGPDHAERTREGLVWLARRIGRRAVLIPAGGVAEAFLAERAASLRHWFLMPGPDPRLAAGGDSALAAYLDLTGQPACGAGPAGSSLRGVAAAPAGWYAGDDMLPSGLMCLREVTRALFGSGGSGRASGGTGPRPGPAVPGTVARQGRRVDYRPGRGLPGMYPRPAGRAALARGGAGHG